MNAGPAGSREKSRATKDGESEPEIDSPTLEDVFNRRVEELLARRGLEYRDLLALLEKAGYTQEVPATVLLNDALAIAAVLDVSPVYLLVPDEESELHITPELAAPTRRVRQWLRGLRPLRDEGSDEFHRSVPLDDLRSELVAENWIRADRVRVAGLVLELKSAIEEGDLRRVKILTDLAASMVDRETLTRANERVEEPISQRHLEDARTKGIRYRRQGGTRREDL